MLGLLEMHSKVVSCLFRKCCFLYIPHLITSQNGLEVAKAGQIADRYNGHSLDRLDSR